MPSTILQPKTHTILLRIIRIGNHAIRAVQIMEDFLSVDQPFLHFIINFFRSAFERNISISIFISFLKNTLQLFVIKRCEIEPFPDIIICIHGRADRQIHHIINNMCFDKLVRCHTQIVIIDMRHLFFRIGSCAAFRLIRRIPPCRIHIIPFPVYLNQVPGMSFA